LRGDLEALGPSGFGVSLTPRSDPLCGGGGALEALPNESTIRAPALPGVAQASAPASRPARPSGLSRLWTSRFRGCPKRRGIEIWLLCTDFRASCRLPPKNGFCKGETARVEESHLPPVTVLYCFRCCHYCCHHEPCCCLPSILNLFARGDIITCLARLKSRWKFRKYR
jgi:hypothetical protein